MIWYSMILYDMIWCDIPLFVAFLIIFFPIICLSQPTSVSYSLFFSLSLLSLCHSLSLSLYACFRFSKYRDYRESLQQFEGVVAACLVLSFQELSLQANLDIQVRRTIRKVEENRGEESKGDVIRGKEIIG